MSALTATERLTKEFGLHVGRSPDGWGSRLQTIQFLPAPREQVFAFFADALQLETITPPWLHFAVLTPAPIVMSAGTLIDYRLRLHCIPLRWRTRINAWEPPSRFVDEQLRGPYRSWVHTHLFEEIDGGTLCHDLVDYTTPGGGMIDMLFVRSDLRKIFTYRRAELARRFGAEEREDRLANRR